MANSDLTQSDIIARIDDWIARLNQLFAQVEEWRQRLSYETDGHCGEMLQRNEELMIKFDVPPRQVPVYTVIHKKKRLSFVPKGLWVIGANGRVNITTNKNLYILVDLEGRDGHPSKWVLVTPNAKQVHRDFDLNTFIELLEE